MKALSIIAGVAVCLMITCSAAFAFPKEPVGFRGYPWGTPISALKFQLVKVEMPKKWNKSVVQLYIVKDSLKTARDPYQIIIGINHKMEATGIAGLSDKDVHDLFAMSVRDHGSPTGIQMDETEFLWIGKHAIINLSTSAGVFMVGSRKGLVLLGLEAIRADDVGVDY